jgi:hypothetical protein
VTCRKFVPLEEEKWNSSANLPVSMCLYGNLKSVCVRNGTSYTYTYRFFILCMYVHMCMYCMYVYVSEIHNILDTCTYIQIHTIHTHTYTAKSASTGVFDAGQRPRLTPWGGTTYPDLLERGFRRDLRVSFAHKMRVLCDRDAL